MRFTDRFVATIRKPESRKVLWEDGEYGKGSFGLRLSPSGSKTWVYMYRDPRSGKARMATLGRYPSMSVAQAHEAYAKSVLSVEQGNDPSTKLADSRREERASPTIDALVNEYIERWAKQNKRSWAEDDRILRHDVLPVWSGIKAKDITRRDIVVLLDSIVERGASIMANRTFEVIRKMFNFAVERAILDTSPASGVKSPSLENRKNRVLNDSEVKLFWQCMWYNKPIVGFYEPLRMAMLFQLATACRTNESLGLRWDEIDGDWWTIPSDRSKNGNPHRLPITPIIRQILDRAKETAGECFVFPSMRKSATGGDKPMIKSAASHGLTRILSAQKQAGVTMPSQLNMAKFTSHDLRRTAATQMAGLGVPRLVIAKLLNHTDRQITALYDLHSYDNEKRDAMNLWSKKLYDLSLIQP